MPSRHTFHPHSFRIVIRERPAFLLESKRPSCKKISESPTHCLYPIQNDAYTVTKIQGQGGLQITFVVVILTLRFGIFQKPTTLSPKKGNVIVLVCCYLHSFFLKSSSSDYATSRVFHTQQTTSDILQSDTSGEANNDFVLPLRNNNPASTTTLNKYKALIVVTSTVKEKLSGRTIVLNNCYYAVYVVCSL